MKAVSCRLFSSFNDMPAKITKRNYLGWCLVIILQLTFCVWETALSKDFSTELTFCPDTTGSNSMVTHPGGGGYSWEFLVEVCHPVPQILILFQTKKCHFPHPFSDLTFRQKIMSSLLTLERKQKILQIHFEFAYFSFFLIWNWNDKYVHTLAKFSRKPYPISDQKGAKTIPFRAAHTYMAYIREYSPPPLHALPGVTYYSIHLDLQDWLQYFG